MKREEKRDTIAYHKNISFIKTNIFFLSYTFNPYDENFDFINI